MCRQEKSVRITAADPVSAHSLLVHQAAFYTGSWQTHHISAEKHWPDFDRLFVGLYNQVARNLRVQVETADEVSSYREKKKPT